MNKTIFLSVAALVACSLADLASAAQDERSVRFTVKSLSGECWWGGATTLGRLEPFGVATNRWTFDFRNDDFGNQVAPIMLSNKGRYVWSDGAFKCDYDNGTLAFEGSRPFELKEGGKTLRDAFLAAAKAHFPASGKLPDLALLAHPQWNTWVELTYNQNERDILAYAKAIRANGFPEGGVIMIDDTWQFGYGIWDFDPRRFRDPKGMVDKLHAMNYKVMLWICPFVSMDSPGYREMAHGLLDTGVKCPVGGLLLLTAEPDFYGRPDVKAVPWWNGRSAIIDFTDPLGAKWFARQLKTLQTKYGVDGFKLDAGDIEEYRRPYVSHAPAEPADFCEAYAKIGLQFPLNEYRACYKMAGQPLVQRLCDKGHDWEAIEQLVPDMIACGLLGHPFVCPDMIGSGSWMAFMPDAPHPYEPEIFVRSAQIHALSPMMQFSAAPWRMLKGEHLKAVRDAAWLRMKFTPYVLKVAKASAKTGEPMLRCLEYAYPGHGWENVKDEFLLGDDLLVAPQTKKGATNRPVAIPPGTWKADDGKSFTGPTVITVATPISRLPYFERQ